MKTMKSLALSVMLLAAALPVSAQTPDPQAPPPQPPPAQPPPAPPPAETKPSFKERVYVGGGVGLSFGTIDYVSLNPLVGFKLAPRVSLDVQPFYRWTRDSRYSPSVDTTDYGAGVFVRVNIIQGLFGEAGYEYTNYEFVNSLGGTARDTHNAYLAGAGYAFPAGRNVSFYTTALYDFSYDGNDPFRPYDSPVRFQVGVSVGF